jgi:hypothetical protein
MKIIKIMVILAVLSMVAAAQDNEWTEEERTHRQGGIVFTMAETGSGFGGYFSWPLFKYYHIGFATDVLFIRDSQEFTYTDYYYGPISINKINNVYLLDFFFIAKRRLFAESMDEGFRPFITAAFGPIYGINHPEKWAKRPPPYGYGLTNTADLTLGGFFGLGVDVNAGTTYFFSIRAQYRIMPFSEQIGETADHSMIELRFELGKRF